MKRKCFVSFKMEDEEFKKKICEEMDIDMIDKSLHEMIDSTDEEYIMSRIRKDYLGDSTVTIHLIGQYSNENLGKEEQKFIKRELQASLYNGAVSKRNGILGVVLPSMDDTIYGGSGICRTCGKGHNYVNINNATTIKEFNYNYYIPHNKCSWAEDDRYCLLVKWSAFALNPEHYIELAYAKRMAPIVEKIRVYPE